MDGVAAALQIVAGVLIQRYPHGLLGGAVLDHGDGTAAAVGDKVEHPGEDQHPRDEEQGRQPGKGTAVVSWVWSWQKKQMVPRADGDGSAVVCGAGSVPFKFQFELFAVEPASASANSARAAARPGPGSVTAAL